VVPQGQDHAQEHPEAAGDHRDRRNCQEGFRHEVDTVMGGCLLRDGCVRGEDG
jgi:hypothetical protein